MLQLINIEKKYTTGDLTQAALNGVSLNLRDNEFVAILGPSGSGKTTLLNIIGGLTLDEPAADLAAILALASSYLDKPIGAQVAAIGEVGLSGEIRSVRQLELRLTEIHRLGFTHCIIPRSGTDALRAPEGLRLLRARNLSEAIAVAL